MLGAWLSFCGFGVLTAFCVWRSWRILRDPAYFERVALRFTFGPYSARTCRGIVRGWLPLTGGALALTAFSALNLYDQVTGTRSASRDALAVALLVVFVAGEVFTLLVAWFNVPKLLVPGYLRGEPGVWQHRRQSARG